ncbi:MAG: hypothetical protein LH606_12105 [Cytophagaceae bacterium]|nr:hypothetical protein [Cytophagaceae bacterium]
MSLKNQYSFLSWARKGLVNSISPVPAGTARASVRLDVLVNGQTVPQTIQVLGPQDVIGMNADMVVRTEPRNWITDYEPNYLPFIEFYEEDFPWRYSPRTPDGAKLQPWLTLVVLKPDEFDADDRSHPLPSFKIKKDASQFFPPADQLWAWAHVHVNGAVTDAAGLDAVVRQNPDHAYSRLFSPRKLKPETPYQAFLVPTYELGRLAGLGLAADNAALLGKASFEGKGAGTAFPYYYRWYFQTGKAGDFEYLLTLLKPFTADKTIGRRDMDVSTPGFDSEWTDAGFPRLLGLEGALKSPLMQSDAWPLPPPTPRPEFENDLERLLNLPEKLVQEGVETPVVSIPFYGAKHILEKTIAITNDPSKDFWLTELNRDPRTRTAAGFGTKVVQTQQENLMRKAWEQVKNIKELNQKIRYVQVAMRAGQQLFVKHLVNLSPAKSLGITALIHTKITNSPTTIRHAIERSTLPVAATSTAFRRLTRPGGTLMRRVGSLETERLVDGLNAGKLTTAPPAPVPKDTNLWEDTFGDPGEGRRVGPPGGTSIFPEGLQKLLAAMNEWLILVFFLIVAGFLLGAGVWLAALAVAGAGVGVFLAIRYAHRQEKLQAIRDATKLTPSLVDELLPNPNFQIIDPKADRQPDQTPPGGGIFGGGSDSFEAERFKVATKNLFGFVAQLPPTEAVRRPLELAKIQSRIYEVIEPQMAIARRFASYAVFPGIREVAPPKLAEVIVPVMAYPDFKEAMYKPLRELGEENVCPGIGRIPPNKITLLLTNQPFVESYMVGLNHEMGRELLWREYPTDQRGSYFRTFWEKQGFVVPDPALNEAQKAEKEKDIPRINTWLKRSQLGSHPNPAPASGQKIEEKLVLTIRSDLFKRYPNTVVFAQRAKWLNQAAKTREMDETLEVNPGQSYNTDLIKTPLFGAEFLPDIKCFGFDLTLAQARGTDQDPGWYFVIMERPGEPRFGMDEPPADFNFAVPGSIKLWNELHWGHIMPTKVAYEQLEVLNMSQFRTPLLNGPLPSDPDDQAQRSEDNAHAWGTQSASLAYILYQAPVKVAVHATEMLDGL